MCNHQLILQAWHGEEIDDLATLDVAGSRAVDEQDLQRQVKRGRLLAAA